MRVWLRRLRGMLGNSLLWGLAWFGGSTVILGAMLMLGVLPRSAWSWEIILEWTRRIGVAGIGAGAVFSAALPALFRGRTLGEVRAPLFILGGAALSGVTFFGALRLMFGMATVHPSPLVFVGLAALFGAGTAGASLAAAKHAHRLELQQAMSSLGSAKDDVAAVVQHEAV